jgi:hypothetical protein
MQMQPRGNRQAAQLDDVGAPARPDTSSTRSIFDETSEKAPLKLPIDAVHGAALEVLPFAQLIG